jgi:hypothetical protein
MTVESQEYQTPKHRFSESVECALNEVRARRMDALARRHRVAIEFRPTAEERQQRHALLNTVFRVNHAAARSLATRYRDRVRPIESRTLPSRLRLSTTRENRGRPFSGGYGHSGLVAAVVLLQISRSAFISLARSAIIAILLFRTNRHTTSTTVIIAARSKSHMASFEAGQRCEKRSFVDPNTQLRKLAFGVLAFTDNAGRY